MSDISGPQAGSTRDATLRVLQYVLLGLAAACWALVLVSHYDPALLPVRVTVSADGPFPAGNAANAFGMGGVAVIHSRSGQRRWALTWAIMAGVWAIMFLLRWTVPPFGG